MVGLDGDKLAIGLVRDCGAAWARRRRTARHSNCARAAEIAREIGARLARHPGLALIIDYGHLASAPGDTLQALRSTFMCHHREPGECDLTAHVDFEALGKALGAGGATV